jgi:hypothetical protein
MDVGFEGKEVAFERMFVDVLAADREPPEPSVGVRATIVGFVGTGRLLERPAFDSSKPTLSALQPVIDLLQPAIDLLRTPIDRLQPSFDFLRPTIDLLQPTIDFV